MGRQKRFDQFGAGAVGGDGEHGEIRLGGGQLVQRRQFGHARDAPGGPEIQHHHAAAPIAGQVPGRAIERGDGDVGQRAGRGDALDVRERTHGHSPSGLIGQRQVLQRRLIRFAQRQHAD